MGLNHVTANRARIAKQRETMFPKQFSSAVGADYRVALKRAEIDAPPTDAPCIVEIDCSVAFVDTFRHLVPCACDILDCSPIDNDIKIWRFTVRVPHWPYQGRKAVLIVQEDLLARTTTLVPAVRQ